MKHSICSMIFCTFTAIVLIGVKTFAADAPESAVSVRVYGVRDLITVVSDYPLSGKLVSPNRIQQGDQPPVAANNYGPQGIISKVNPPTTALDTLVQVIIETIDAPSWKTNGGTTGAISEINDQLVITQTAPNHTAIQRLLNDLRSGRSPMVRIRADWVFLVPGQIEKVLVGGKDDGSALPEISRDQLDKLPVDVVRYTAQVACFSGQTVHLASGHAKSTVTSSAVVVSSNAVGTEPKAEIVQYGLCLQINPIISDSTATLDLMSETSESDGKETPQIRDLDQINAVVQHFHTTVEVPLKKAVLVQGMTLEPTLNEPAGKQLYLIVEADSGN